MTPSTMPALREALTGDEYDDEFSAAKRRVDPRDLKLPNPTLPEFTDTIDRDTPWYPVEAYCNGGHRSPMWDSEMLVACGRWQTNPALAETALFHAHQAGYDGWVLKALAARIAWSQLRIDDALAFADMALQAAPKDRRPLIAAWAFDAAVYDYKIYLADRLAEKFPVANDDDRSNLQDTIHRYEVHPLQARLEPIARLASLQETDLTAKLANMKIKGENAPEGKLKQFQKAGKITISAPSGTYWLLGLGPPAPNVDLSMSFQIAPTDEKKSDWDKTLQIGLIDPKDGEKSICVVDLNTRNHVHVEYGGPEPPLAAPPDADWSDHGALRMVLLGRDLEVWVDGKRVFYGPSWNDRDNRRAGFYIKPVGVHATLTDISWKAIEGEPVK